MPQQHRSTVFRRRPGSIDKTASAVLMMRLRAFGERRPRVVDEPLTSRSVYGTAQAQTLLDRLSERDIIQVNIHVTTPSAQYLTPWSLTFHLPPSGRRPSTRTEQTESVSPLRPEHRPGSWFSVALVSFIHRPHSSEPHTGQVLCPCSDLIQLRLCRVSCRHIVLALPSMSGRPRNFFSP